MSSEFEDLHIMRKRVNYMFNLLCAKRGCNDIKLFYHILKYLQTLLANNRIYGRIYTNESQTDKYLLDKHILHIGSLIQKQTRQKLLMYEIENEFNILTIIAIESILVLLQHELLQLHVTF